LVDIGFFYNTGLGPPKNYHLAMQYYLKAAASGNCTAYANIGGLYFNGDGVPQNSVQAQEWFGKARNCRGEQWQGIREKAARYQERAAKGELPTVQLPRTTSQGLSAGMSDDEKILRFFLGGLSLGAAYAFLREPDGAKAMQQFREGQDALNEERRHDYEQLKLSNDMVGLPTTAMPPLMQ
jgi:TPR repeat protein